MGTSSISVDDVVSIAQEIESEDPIDWGMLSISEEEAYRLMASSIIEQFDGPLTEEKRFLMIVTITKLVVENFVLNLRLESR